MPETAPTAAVECALCGLTVGSDPFRRTFEEGQDKPFCCIGCMNVYAILVESGAVTGGADLRDTELFRQSLALGLVSNRARDGGKVGIAPGTPALEKLYHVPGMWCSSCAWLIEHSLGAQHGVEKAEVFFTSDLLKVRYYPQVLPPGQIVERVRRLGYAISEFTGEQQTAEPERQSLLLRLGIAAFLWVNTMTMNLAAYLGYFDQMPGSFRALLPFLAMGLASPVVFYSAQPILRTAWIGLRRGQARMETLLSLGIFAAYGYSAIQAFSGGAHIYFDIACAIVTLLLLGKYIEHGAKERTTRAVTSLYRVLPTKARIFSGGRERFVSIEALKAGDVFMVKAGERIPADGVVVEGESHVDESLLTGESAPVEKSPGAAVAGGSVNTGGVLQVRATAAGDSSTLARIIRMVEHALGTRSEIERMVDRVSRVFVPAVMALSAVTFALGLFLGLPAWDAMMRAITVLVIACPCALGVATPLALTAALGAASRRGILVGDSRVLDTVRRLDAVVLDKTGTVTEGAFQLLEVNPDHLPVIAALEAYSEHPLARAVMQKAEESDFRLHPADHVHIEKGQGIAGQVGGLSVFIGSRRFMAHFDPRFSNGGEHLAGIATTVYYGWDKRVQGKLVFGDRIRPEAARVVDDLRNRGLAVYLVSGDSRAATAEVARGLKVDDFAPETLPFDKAAFVDDLRRAGKVVAMVGDGVNDAPALAKADLGIAMGSGTELAMKAAAIVLMGSDLTRIPEAFDLVARTMQIVRQNLFWAFFYNVVGISFAMAGFLNPIVAAAAMVASSLFVTVNSHRLSRPAGSRID